MTATRPRHAHHPRHPRHPRHLHHARHRVRPRPPAPLAALLPLLTLAVLLAAPPAGVAESPGVAIDRDAPPPVVEPTRRARIEQIDSRAGHPAPRVDLDPAVLGPLPGDEAPALRREGEFIVSRLGRVRHLDAQGGRWAFQPTSDEQNGDTPLPPMVLQHSSRLQMIADYVRQAQQREANQGRQPPTSRPADAAQGTGGGTTGVTEGDMAGADAWFVLSGRVHTYRGVNYLLVTSMQPRSEPDAEADAADDAGAADGEADEAPLDALLEDLMHRRAPAPGSAVELPRDAEATRNASLLDEGELIMQRRGRIARSRDGAEAVFVFDADAQHSPEPPLRLLPCQLLATMEDTATQRGGSTIFVVSGQVYTYRGTNYLLPTNMRVAQAYGHIE
ncbi:MAG: hypothetical protein WD009_07075 [Phycisphaeraceae bacterium]